jgi:hypothetical protein
MSAIAHTINAERFPSLAGTGAIAVDVEAAAEGRRRYWAELGFLRMSKPSFGAAPLSAIGQCAA